MSEILTNGYIKPSTGDRGGDFFPELEGNIQRVNDHNHNGANSEKLTAEAITNLTDTILPGAWVVQPSGLYRAAVTMPGNKVFDTTTISLVTNNKTLMGDIEKVTANTFYVYVNDNTLTVGIKYI